MKKRGTLSDSKIKEIDFKAFAHENRLDILEFLSQQQESLTVSDITKGLNQWLKKTLKDAAVNAHIKHLLERGFLGEEGKKIGGKWVSKYKMTNYGFDFYKNMMKEYGTFDGKRPKEIKGKLAKKYLKK